MEKSFREESQMRMSWPKVVITAVALFVLTGAAQAALQEKPVIDGVNNAVAVLRYLHKQVAEAEANLSLVHASKELTESQLKSQQQLHAQAIKDGRLEQAEFYRNRLVRLERQVKRLNEFDFDSIYAQRVADAQVQIKVYTEEMNARIREYEALFGKKPKVDISFQDIYDRYSKTRADAAFYLDLEGD
jgi:hypothetical protein